MIRLGSKIILLHTAQSYSFCKSQSYIDLVIVIFVLCSTQVTIKGIDEINHISSIRWHPMSPSYNNHVSLFIFGATTSQVTSRLAW